MNHPRLADWRPHELMATVSELLADEPLVSHAVRDRLRQEKPKLVREAIAQLIAAGHVDERDGTLRLVWPYVRATTCPEPTTANRLIASARTETTTLVHAHTQAIESGNDHERRRLHNEIHKAREYLEAAARFLDAASPRETAP